MAQSIGARVAVSGGIGRGAATEGIENQKKCARHFNQYRANAGAFELGQTQGQMNPQPDPQLVEAAWRAHANAYGRYSGFAVGAAIRLDNGQVFAGCNVENASYGATICAERGAICASIASGGARPIEEIVVVSDGEVPWPPCGMCRQFISEFAAPDCAVYALGQSDRVRAWRLRELLPDSFGAADMRGDGQDGGG